MVSPRNRERNRNTESNRDTHQANPEQLRHADELAINPVPDADLIEGTPGQQEERPRVGFGAVVPSTDDGVTRHRTSDEPVSVMPWMTLAERELMMIHVLRCASLFAEASRVLRVEHFTEPYEVIWAVTWVSACDLHAEFGRAPSAEMLRVAVMSRVEAHPTEIPPAGIIELGGFLSRVFDYVEAEGWDDYGRALLHRFLREREVSRPLMQTVREYGDSCPQDIVGLVADLQLRIERVESFCIVSSNERIFTPSEFAAEAFQQEWLIPGFLVRGQPSMIVGPSKALKTSLAIDLAISLGLGTPALLFGRFPTSQPSQRVGLISGESGAATIKDTFRRICADRQCRIENTNVYLWFRVPKIETEMALLSNAIRQYGWTVVILDPLYLSLLAGHSDPDAASKLHVVGPRLKELCDTCTRLGCTPILVHHTTKHLSGRRDNERYEPLDLTDAHGAGMAEFARQWILVNRREAYSEEGTVERVWVRVGGSAGHSGLYALDVDQGRFDVAECRRQHWRVSVMDPATARAQAGRNQETRRETAEAPERERMERQIIDILRNRTHTFNALATALAIPRSNRILMSVFAQLQVAGIVRDTGNTFRSGALFGLADNSAQSCPARRAGGV